MISAGDFRNGVTFELDGQVVQVVEFQHVKPGKGAAFVRTKYKNVITGSVVETSFNPTAKFPTAFVERKDMQYSYNDGDLYYFMDLETYEQVPISASILGDNFKFVKEEMICKILSYKGNVFGVEPPNFVELRLHRPIRASRAIQLQTLQSLLHLRQVQRSRFLSLSTRARSFRLIQEQASICQEHKLGNILFIL